MSIVSGRIRRYAIVFGCFLSLSEGPEVVQADDTPESQGAVSEIDVFIDEMAEKHGFDRGELKRILGHARFKHSVLRAVSEPAEAKPWDEYRSRFISDARVQGGLKFWDTNAQALVVARLIYGVPEALTTAIIGVETGYGRYTGSHRVLDALTTLAFFYPSRAPMFRRELEHYLLLAREEGWPPSSIKGSYAGAIGLAQFMPTSYRRYGIDFDGDGRCDLSRNSRDAIGSVANYFSLHGWEPGLPVVVRAEVSATLTGSGLDTRRSIAEWRRQGVMPSELVPDDQEAMLFGLRTQEGPEYWLGFGNFYVITRYNHSLNYAMAVYQLSLRIQALRAQSQPSLFE